MTSLPLDEERPGSGPLRREYERRVARGDIRRDPAQLDIVDILDRLLQELSASPSPASRGLLGRLFGRRNGALQVKGLYLHGGVGRGKTMLMDMFFALLPETSARRAHFHDFMADVHDRIQTHRQALKDGRTKQADPIPPVAQALAREAHILCFDEFAVTDIADAMVLSRLFESLFQEGVVLVATSNVAPQDLYRDGLNRGLFLPFIDLLESRVEVVDLDSETDYRLEKLDRMPVYLTPLGPETERIMDEAWEAATAGHETPPTHLTVMGRDITVPRARGRVARFSFADLCERPLGARDFLAVAASFDTVFIDRVPVLGAQRRNEAKRFILLIDTFYDRSVQTVISAEVAPDALYQGRTGTEAFEFARAASRLNEMQSAQWRAAARKRAAAARGKGS